MSFLKNLVNAGKTVAKTAAPIIANAFLPGSGAVVAGVENKMSKAKPGSAGSIGKARSQDRARMKQSYGYGGSGRGL